MVIVSRLSRFIKAVLNNNSIMLLCCCSTQYKQGNAFVVQSVALSVTVVVSHCPLCVDYYLTEFAIIAIIQV